MIRKRPRWFDLPRAERRAIVTMLWLVPAMHVAVRVFDYRRTRQWLERRAHRRAAARGNASTDVVVWRLATARITRYSWFPGNCLSRSLALFYVLRARGHQAQLQLGVSRAGGIFAAHAWVTLGQTVLNDTQDVATRFAPFSSPPAQRAFD